ncbi:MAG TPA: hypothetical protein VF794_12270 [Archangium sp.]|uniref:hypothetical protein n=1 Tax=Archangium sp. TaxID=1872627 RepID=UPI002ED9E2BC
MGELVRQQPESAEALTRIHQRARVEGWPEAEPARMLARKVQGLRHRLEALTRERLGVEDLARLHQVLGQTLAPPVASDEEVLCRGAFMRTPALLSPLLRSGIVLGIFCALLGVPILGPRVLLVPLLPSIGYALQRLYSGRFWLTRKRLVWQPTGRAALHIPLHAIRPGGVRRLSASTVEVSLVDGRSFRFRLIEGTHYLLTLLERHVPSSRPGA